MAFYTLKNVKFMSIFHFNRPISDIERAERCFNGELLIFKNIAAMHDLIEFSDQLLKESLGDIEAIDAQQQFQPEAFLQRTGNAQKAFRTSQEAKALFFKAIEQCGVDLNHTYYDHFPMRIVPSDKAYDGANCGVISHHRDTWGSNIHSQINWWAPLYELEENRTIALYPDYWAKPIANDTATWSHLEFLKKRNEAPPERKGTYPSAPRPLAEVDESNMVKVMLAPGDVLCFASAHLHGSVPNTSQIPRFSVEMRTISKPDLVANRRAPNIDNAGEKHMYQWFRHIRNKEILSV